MSAEPRPSPAGPYLSSGTKGRGASDVAPAREAGPLAGARGVPAFVHRTVTGRGRPSPLVSCGTRTVATSDQPRLMCGAGQVGPPRPVTTPPRWNGSRSWKCEIAKTLETKTTPLVSRSSAAGQPLVSRSSAARQPLGGRWPRKTPWGPGLSVAGLGQSAGPRTRAHEPPIRQAVELAARAQPPATFPR